MDALKLIIEQEIEKFRLHGHEFLNGEINAAEFKGKSGGMGAYAQRGGTSFMVRLRIPAGVMSRKHANLIKKYIDKYNIKKIHLTTRQAVQLHDLGIDDVCDIMHDSLENGLFTRGGGGNYPRNIALSPLSGAAENEAFDVTPYAILVNNHFMNKMFTYKLPRKLKIGFSNSSDDTANTTLTDLGFLAVNDNGKKYFKLFIAGGLGRNPAVGVQYDEIVNPEDVLYHVEAMTRLFIAEGNYENKNKARTRYIVDSLGREKFIELYKTHFDLVKKSTNFDCVTDNPYEVNFEADDSKVIDENECLISQKQKGLYTVVVQPLAGEMPSDEYFKLVDFINKYENAEIRLSMTESMYIRNLTAEQALELLDITENVRQKTTCEQSISCIGVPTCQMGIEQSQKLLINILDYLREKKADTSIIPAIHISGCGNSCSRHQVNSIGFAGKKKKVDSKTEDVFELHVGGHFSENETSLGIICGDILFDRIPEFIYEVYLKLKENDISFIKFIDEKWEDFNELTKKYIV